MGVERTAAPRGFGRSKKSASRVKDTLDLAFELGVSPRRIFGWEPEETTVHEYDTNGRLTRSVTTREPEWDATSLALMLAHQSNRADIGPHGIPTEVATDPKNQFKFTVPLPTVDYAAKELARVQDAYYKTNYSDKKIPIQSAGDLWSVKLKK